MLTGAATNREEDQGGEDRSADASNAETLRPSAGKREPAALDQRCTVMCHPASPAVSVAKRLTDVV
jgi:hypothetical protein